ncbi:STAS/SEC14 domain-containing protein [Cognatishimia activa]|uniref:STAS/SEC14 domain-containing protein n=1 Tax=Cognatishimia activa TaxID=1715691 RepID=UPI00222F0197|nr:STAS/SEC14 domain-containing protein [Cognatishimia activa]UZD89911.1 STAS/SEC14 domain-containing protein [Cognatishimia activa]
MLKVTKTGENRVDIELSGKIDAINMRVALDEMIHASENIEHGRMLYTIPEFAMPTLSAIGVEMTYLPKLFSLLGKFDRCAVLTDSGWLQKAAEIEGALFPGIDIKSFDLKETEAAESWLAETG